MSFFNGYIIAREQAFGLSAAVPVAPPVPIPIQQYGTFQRKRPRKISFKVLKLMESYLEMKLQTCKNH
jgi:hypothetical protein